MNHDWPTGSGDRTIIRPSPGGRAPATPPTALPSRHVPPPTKEIPPPHAGGIPGDSAAVFNVVASGGLSPLVRSALPLLLLATGLRGARDHADVPGLYADTVRQVQAFEKGASDLGVAPESLLAARYALCTFIDEVVMNTPWGSASLWASSPLLLAFHRETQGGDKFFQMVDRVLADREPRRDLIEFFYVCLALGFEGRYRVVSGGAGKLTELRERLFARIRGWRDPQQGELSPRWRGVQDRRSRLVRSLPGWILFTVAALIAGSLFLTLHHGLNRAVAPVTAQLNEIRWATFESPAPPPIVVAQPPIPRPTLPELLRGVEPERLQIASEDGGVTRLTLIGEVFASGSVQVTDAFASLLLRIGAALEDVDGRAMVEGHSDNVPVRSLRYKDNLELSRVRARNAAEILRGRLSDPGRVQYTGFGEDRPLFEPASLPENRARNRRVEIIHRPDGTGA